MLLIIIKLSVHYIFNSITNCKIDVLKLGFFILKTICFSKLLTDFSKILIIYVIKENEHFLYIDYFLIYIVYKIYIRKIFIQIIL